MEIGKNIKNFRTILNVKQNKLAEILGVKPTYIYRIESGIIKEPGVITVLKIVKTLDVRLNDIIVGDFEGYKKRGTGRIIKETEYDYDQITEGLNALINNPDLQRAVDITPEEIEWCKTIRHGAKERPTPYTYIDYIKARRRTKENQS